MAKKYRLKKGPKIGVIIFIILLIATLYGLKLYKNYQYQQTYEYKLLTINYPLEETNILISKLSNQQLDTLLTREYHPEHAKLVNEDYFLFKNLDRYLNYLTSHKDYDYKTLVALINVGRDGIFYDEPKMTDTSKRHLMLVNKYFYLDKDYKPETNIKASDWYAYANNTLTEITYDAFKELRDAAQREGYMIMLLSSYRSYKTQSDIYNQYKTTMGAKKADSLAARAGHSEHQTGYAIDVADFADQENNFVATESYIWMINNAYKYGFILRYPKEKEDITGYTYEPWHYRYVGKDIALKIHQEQITFDEYYAFYLDK